MINNNFNSKEAVISIETAKEKHFLFLVGGEYVMYHYNESSDPSLNVKPFAELTDYYETAKLAKYVSIEMFKMIREKLNIYKKKLGVSNGYIETLNRTTEEGGLKINGVFKSKPFFVIHEGFIGWRQYIQTLDTVEFIQLVDVLDTKYPELTYTKEKEIAAI